ncbi:MAG: PqqD family protein [Anaerolineales bacterium]
MQEIIQYQRNPDYIYRKIVEETVLVPIHQNVADLNCIYTLNELGAFIWETLEKPHSKGELQAAILATYDAEPEVLLQDLTEFLDEMIGIGALQEV